MAKQTRARGLRVIGVINENSLLLFHDLHNAATVVGIAVQLWVERKNLRLTIRFTILYQDLCGSLLDARKSFDTVWHNGSFYTLKPHGKLGLLMVLFNTLANGSTTNPHETRRSSHSIPLRE